MHTLMHPLPPLRVATPPLLFVLDLFNLRGYVGYSKLFREKKSGPRMRRWGWTRSVSDCLL